MTVTSHYDDEDLSSFILHTIAATRTPPLKGKAVISESARQFIESLIDSAKKGAPLKQLIERELQKESNLLRCNHIIDVDAAGLARPPHLATSINDLWLVLKDEYRPNKRVAVPADEVAFGRIVYICAPLPAASLLLLVCLKPFFNMDFLLSTAISYGSTRTTIPNPSVDPAYRMTWSFSLKYYYLTEMEETLYPDQKSGPFHESVPNVRICRGRSTVALSFAKAQSSTSGIHTPPTPITTEPWRILVLAFNDRIEEEYTKNTGNGIEAYLWCIGNELVAARRSLRDLSNEIIKAAVLSDDFLFDFGEQHKLLFEDKTYSLSKTYFWALQSLRIINDCMDSIVTEWKLCDKALLLKLLPQLVPRQNELSMHPHIARIEEQLTMLMALKTTNQLKQEEIKSLRDGLFNASAVLEARTTTSQGQNIRILTLISMLFLPASFVTSIFGMGTVLPASTSLTTFGIVFSVVCGTAYLLIGSFEIRSRRKVRAKTTAQFDIMARIQSIKRLMDTGKRKTNEKQGLV